MTITCPTCKRSFTSYRGMNGHRRVCSLQSCTKNKKGTKRKVEYATTEFHPLQQRHCASDSEDTLEELKLHEDWNDDFIESHEPLVFGLDAHINANSVHHTSHLYFVYQLKINERYDRNNETAPFEVRRTQGVDNSTTWEDYVIINNFISNYNLSEAAGDGKFAKWYFLCRLSTTVSEWY